MSKNFDELPAASALTGTETTAVNQAGVSKKTTLDAIKAFISSAFEAAGAVAAGINAHLAAYTHSDIAHANRTALNAVAGVNTGDQDLSGYARLDESSFTSDITIKGMSLGNGPGVSVDNYSNLMFGYNALKTNTSGTLCVAIGLNALVFNTTGSSNVAIGAWALNSNAEGSVNVAIGQEALLNNQASYNTAIGAAALKLNVSGVSNTGIGWGALNDNTTGSYNSAIGQFALRQVTGSSNVGIGDSAGMVLISGSQNIFIGASSGTSGSQKVDASNSIAIGYGAYTTKSNQVVVGNASVTETQLYGNVIAPSLSTGLVVNTHIIAYLSVSVTSIVANYAGTMTITLPLASSFPGRIVMVKTIQAQAVVSSSANVVPLAGGAASTAILSAVAGKWATIQSDGASWQIMQAN